MSQMVKNPPAMLETWVPGLGKYPREGNGYPLQYSGLENSTDRGGWQATVHGVTKSQTALSDFDSPTPALAGRFFTTEPPPKL